MNDDSGKRDHFSGLSQVVTLGIEKIEECSIVHLVNKHSCNVDCK